MLKVQIIYPAYNQSLDQPGMWELLRHMWSETPGGLMVRGAYITNIPNDPSTGVDPIYFFGRRPDSPEVWHGDVAHAQLFSNIQDLISELEKMRQESSRGNDDGQYFNHEHRSQLGYRVSVYPVYWNPLYTPHFEMVRDKQHYG
jgi:hypothetical protein